MSAIVQLEERVLETHLVGGRFRSGEAAKRWRHIATTWPHAVFTVTARDGLEFGLRFELSGYPRSPATAQPWDVACNTPLDPGAWPTGQARVPLAFNPGWQGGACLYLPCDRLSIEGHPNWLHEHPSLVWNRALGVVHYLRIVHDLLNSGDYGGRRAA